MTRATLAIVAAFAAIFATAETNRMATENWTRNRIGEATNATLQAAKEYADATLGNAIAAKADKTEINSLSNRVEELTGGAVTERDVQRIADEKVAGRRGYMDMTVLKQDATSGLQRGGVEYWKIKTGAYPAFTIPWDESTKSFHETAIINQGEHELEITSMALMSTSMDGSDGDRVRFLLTVDGVSVTNWSNQSEITIVGIGRLWAKTLDNLAKQSYVDAAVKNYVPVTRKVNGQQLTSDIDIEGMTDNAAILTNGALKTKSGTAITAAEISGAQTAVDVQTAIAAAGHMTRTEADAAYYPKDQGQAWTTYWDGDDVRVTVTNYDSVSHLPALYLEQRTNETAMATNLFRVVWREMAHWEKFLGSGWDWDGQWQGFKAWAAGIVAQIEEKADRAWGFFDSHTGQYAPDGYTSISSEHIMLCKGASYQKTVTTRGDVWVLTADEPYEPTGVSTNGGFQLKDGDGNVQFEIVKGDKVTVKAQANRVTVEDGTTLVVVYNVIAPEHPAGETCLALETAEWKKEDAADCPATVVWSGSSGNWVARITPKSGLATGRCFFKATYQRGGDTYINNKCAVGMSQIVLGGVTYNLGTATISGHTVLTLTPAN